MRNRAWHHFLVKSSVACQRTAMGGCMWNCARGGERRSTWQVSWKTSLSSLWCLPPPLKWEKLNRCWAAPGGFIRGAMIKTHMDPEPAADHSSGLRYRVLQSIITKQRLQTEDYHHSVSFLIGCSTDDGDDDDGNHRLTELVWAQIQALASFKNAYDRMWLNLKKRLCLHRNKWVLPGYKLKNMRA